MSAFVVDPYHVAYLHTYAVKHGLWDDDEPATTMFNECVRSVMYRYPQDAEGDLPGRIGYTTRLRDDHRWALIAGETFEPGRVIAAVHCLDYQSCETPDWESTPAYGYLQAIQRHVYAAAGIPIDAPYDVYSKVPGYEGTWEISKSRNAA